MVCLVIQRFLEGLPGGSEATAEAVALSRGRRWVPGGRQGLVVGSGGKESRDIFSLKNLQGTFSPNVCLSCSPPAAEYALAVECQF